MANGKFISVEGTEGAGKSTALTFIKDYLLKARKDVLWTREPGGTEIGEELRNVVLHPKCEEPISAETECLLMFAARAQHIKKVILPALNSGKWVATDRFVDASYAYQGGGRGLDLTRIGQLDQWIVDAHYPDLTILLDVPPEVGIERTLMRGAGHDRIEREQLDFFKRVRAVYLERAEKEPKRIKIIDATKPLYAVESQIKIVMDKFLIKSS